MRAPIGRPGEPCVIDGVLYASQAEAARALGVTPATISKRLRRPHGAVSSRPRPCVIHGRAYPSQSAAARALGVDESTIRERLKRRTTERTPA